MEHKHRTRSVRENNNHFFRAQVANRRFGFERNRNQWLFNSQISCALAATRQPNAVRLAFRGALGRRYEVEDRISTESFGFVEIDPAAGRPTDQDKL